MNGQTATHHKTKTKARAVGTGYNLAPCCWITVKNMTSEEQKRYINYLAERANADDLEKRAMRLVLQDFLDKQKEYDERLSKLDDVLSDVKDLKTSLASEIKRRKAAERKVDDLKAKLKFANKNCFGDKSYGSKKKNSDDESDRTQDKDDFDGTSSSLLENL